MGNGVQNARNASIRWIKRDVLAALGTAVLIGLFAALFYQVIAQLVHVWSTDENNSHGFLVPLVTIYLIWERRDRLVSLEPRSNIYGIFIVTAGIAILLSGKIANLNFLCYSSVIVVVTGVLLYLLGTNIVRVMVFPLLFLWLMVPIPGTVFDVVGLPLQTVAAKSATVSLQLLNIPVLREGNIIELPNTRLEVAEACSGIRSLTSLVALSLLLAYFTQKGWIRRGLIVLSAIPIAVISNAFRVSGTGVLTYHYGPSVAKGFYHLFAGWVIFLVAFALLGLEIYIFSLVKERDKGLRRRGRS